MAEKVKEKKVEKKNNSEKTVKTDVTEKNKEVKGQIKAKVDDDLVLNIKKLNYKYTDKDAAVKSVGEINLYKGDFVIIRGPNGCGKSTLLKFLRRDHEIAEYCEATEEGAECYINGVKELEGVNIFTKLSEKDISVIRSKIDFIDQDDYVIDRIKVLENLMLPSMIYANEFLKKDKEEYKMKIEQLEKLVDSYFDDGTISFITKQQAKKKKYRELSGGQKKIIHVISRIIKAQLFGAKILLMDEPLNNLDIYNKILLNQLIEKLRKENPDVVILIITHCLVFKNINKTIRYTKGKDGNYSVTLIKGEVACQNCLVDD